MSLFPEQQNSLDFPQPLSEKYRPRTIDGFIGLEKQRKILSAFAKRPCASAWLFPGPSGIGKTTMAIALCETIHGELHHIPSQQANIENLEEVIRMCWYVPKNNTFHVVLVDELEYCSQAFKTHLLSKLDATAPVPQTIWIFTTNGTEEELRQKLEAKFLSRCRVLEFSSYGMRSPLAGMLADVWLKETGTVGTLNWERIAKDNENNVRGALSALELELLAV